MSDDEELDRRIEHQNERYAFLIEEALRHFGQWDVFDPVVWAILRVVQAQNDLATAYLATATGAGPERMVDAALAERRAAIEALRQAIIEDEETSK
jgi:hypothetical protein